MTTKQVVLWSWLTKSETKKEFYCPPDVHVTNEELAAELQKQIQNNRLPAEVDLYEVNWDDTDTKQIRVLVKYTGPDAKADVLRFLIGVDQMGNFAYVEQKILLRPPDLPKVPRKRKSNKYSGVPEGLGCLLSLLIIPLIIYLQEQSEVDAWNAEAARETAAWDAALENWQNQTLHMAYLSKTDDIFGRFTLAINSTVNDVLTKLFLDRQAELRQQRETEQTQEAIEKELEKLKASAFK